MKLFIRSAQWDILFGLDRIKMNIAFTHVKCETKQKTVFLCIKHIFFVDEKFVFFTIPNLLILKYVSISDQKCAWTWLVAASVSGAIPHWDYELDWRSIEKLSKLLRKWWRRKFHRHKLWTISIQQQARYITFKLYYAPLSKLNNICNNFSFVKYLKFDISLPTVR